MLDADGVAGDGGVNEGEGRGADGTGTDKFGGGIGGGGGGDFFCITGGPCVGVSVAAGTEGKNGF